MIFEYVCMDNLYIYVYVLYAIIDLVSCMGRFLWQTHLRYKCQIEQAQLSVGANAAAAAAAVGDSAKIGNREAAHW